MALANANKQCKAAILSLPMELAPTLDDMLQVPTLNREALRKRYHWKFLPQGMKNSAFVCQQYLSFLLSPVRAAVGEAIILHYMDEVLVCAPNDDLLSQVLDLTIDSLVAAGFELQEEKIQRMPPWKHLGLETGKRTIVPQKLAVKNIIKTLADVQQLCGSLNWVLSLENNELPVILTVTFTDNYLERTAGVRQIEMKELKIQGYEVSSAFQQKSPDVIVKDPATRETKSPHDLVTWGCGYTYVSTPPGPKLRIATSQFQRNKGFRDQGILILFQRPVQCKLSQKINLRQINNIIEAIGFLQPGMPSLTMLPQNWKLAVIDIKDCFFQIPLHPDNAPRFAFSVPTISRETPRKRCHWWVLLQGMKDRPVIWQWYVASLLSPIRAAVEKAIIHHYMDGVLVCARSDDVLTHALDLTISALIVAELKLQESKIQRMPPWRYLGLELGKRTIVLQKFANKTKIKTLADVHQLCGALNWVRPWLGLTTEDLAPLFELLKGGEELSSSRVLTLEAEKALEKVQNIMSMRQANWYEPDLPF
ncbi:hypothetical protein DUI87_04894 [Hirundo rustica rustica]|uniref:ribonuclease H n=1 Tax=Hirundo rustica rustica TaxID=333673 RepID=A0A3M0KXP6_HIRRU|nr:hypothetical protein DUI87_04894 [Hirundo rustica rustica]